MCAAYSLQQLQAGFYAAISDAPQPQFCDQKNVETCNPGPGTMLNIANNV